MATSWTNRSKSSSTLTPQSKTSSTISSQTKNIIAYLRSLITTDAGDRVLVGTNEDEVLIWTADTSGWDTRTKN